MSHRPQQPPTPAADAFTVHRAAVDGELKLAYLREGVGGYPLLLIHGYPETKRIWWRNIQPLVDAGYEVIVPDLRGYGDSDLSANNQYDIVYYSKDLYTLVHKVLGHQRCGIIAGDVGGAVACDMANRYPELVERLIFFNSVPPLVLDQVDWYADRGLNLDPLVDHPTGDYRIRQGRDWRELLAELDSEQRRLRYVRDFYEHRLWAAPYSFEEADYAFMVAPFADADRLAAAWAPYQLSYDRQMTEMPLLAQQVETKTMVLYGPEDNVVPDDFSKRCEIAFPNCIGPLTVPESGHFLQWERADVLNNLAMVFFSECRDKA